MMITNFGDQAGKVHLVGAGPGDPELLTVKAARLLAAADVVLHDDLVSAEILALAGRQAMLVNVGKRCGRKKITQHEINKLMIESARRGTDVVRLKSGDPGVFGRLAEEIDALDAAGVPWEVVPGVTAAVAAAASVGASLTDRRSSSRMLMVSGHRADADKDGTREAASDRWRENTVNWQDLACDETTIAVYMPGHEFAPLRAELLKAGVDPEAPAVIVSRASTSGQQHHRATVATLDATPLMPAPTILLVGKALGRVGGVLNKNVAKNELQSLIAEAKLSEERGKIL